jgi:hypothetical protein
MSSRNHVSEDIKNPHEIHDTLNEIMHVIGEMSGPFPATDFLKNLSENGRFASHFRDWFKRKYREISMKSDDASVKYREIMSIYVKKADHTLGFDDGKVNDIGLRSVTSHMGNADVSDKFLEAMLMNREEFLISMDINERQSFSSNVMFQPFKRRILLMPILPTRSIQEVIEDISRQYDHKISKEDHSFLETDLALACFNDGLEAVMKTHWISEKENIHHVCKISSSCHWNDGPEKDRLLCLLSSIGFNSEVAQNAIAHIMGSSTAKADIIAEGKDWPSIGKLALNGHEVSIEKIASEFIKQTAGIRYTWDKRSCRDSILDFIEEIPIGHIARKNKRVLDIIDRYFSDSRQGDEFFAKNNGFFFEMSVFEAIARGPDASRHIKDIIRHERTCPTSRDVQEYYQPGNILGFREAIAENPESWNSALMSLYQEKSDANHEVHLCRADVAIWKYAGKSPSVAEFMVASASPLSLTPQNTAPFLISSEIIAKKVRSIVDKIINQDWKKKVMRRDDYGDTRDSATMSILEKAIKKHAEDLWPSCEEFINKHPTRYSKKS